MRTKIFSTALVLAVFLSGCSQGDFGEAGSGGMQEVFFQTADNVQIAANFSPSETGDTTKAVVLVHMLGRNKDSWGSFPKELTSKGYSVLSIDLRGHGKSGGGSYNSFTDEQWNAATLDIKAAKQFLQGKVEQSVQVYLVGASIGANLVLNYASQDTSIKKIVLLSPGRDYRGVVSEPFMQSFGGRSVLIAASSEDEFAFSSSQTLFDLASGDKEFKQYQNKGHGTNMFSGTDLSEFIIAWLDK